MEGEEGKDTEEGKQKLSKEVTEKQRRLRDRKKI